MDKIHPIVSGNKIFKLKYFLEEALAGRKEIVTFGGAYSNHLAATAFACRERNIKSVGIVRGERAAALSHTLAFCLENGMQLEFISREAYKKISSGHMDYYREEKSGDYVLVPEGGFSRRGVKGAAEIVAEIDQSLYSHICIPIGTATTFAGIISAASPGTVVLGFPVLKNMHDIPKRLVQLGVEQHTLYEIFGDYHFGGYARHTPSLLRFINSFYQRYHVPLDFVYTGKMFYGISDLLTKRYFPAGSSILAIHTGGLQGNLSLGSDVLIF